MIKYCTWVNEAIKIIQISLSCVLSLSPSPYIK